MQRPSYNPVPGGGERYLPGWHIARSDDASRSYQLIHQLAGDTVDLRSGIGRAYLLQWLSLAPVDEPRFQWTVSFPFQRQDELQVTLELDGNREVIPSATSLYDFEAETGPVYWMDPTLGRLLFRNLATVEKDLQSTTGTYTVSGEVSGLVADANIYWQGETTDPWQTLRADSADVSGDTFRIPVSGLITVRVTSASRLEHLATGTVILERNGVRTTSLPLIQETRANFFDGWGSLLDIPRLDDEDNLAYRARLLAEIQAPPSSTPPGVIRGIASRLGLLESTAWDGVSSLTLDASGTLEITAVHLVGVERYRAVEEELAAEPRASTSTAVDTYYGSYQDWRSGWKVYVDGLPQSAATLSGNVVTLGAATSGRVTAEYSIEQFTLSRDASGYVTGIVPGQGLPSGAYLVLYSRGVNVHTLGLSDVQEALLLTADGLPNRLFQDLYRRLQSGSIVSLGRAGWDNAYWFADEESQPGSTQLLLSFDAHLALRPDG